MNVGPRQVASVSIGRSKPLKNKKKVKYKGKYLFLFSFRKFITKAKCIYRGQKQKNLAARFLSLEVRNNINIVESVKSWHQKGRIFWFQSLEKYFQGDIVSEIQFRPT